METQATRPINRAGQLSAAQRIAAAIDELVRHWLLIANLLLGIFVITPWLAPVFMHAGWEGAGRAIYFVYGFFCHQLPERSWFLFGRQFTLPLAEVERLGKVGGGMFELRRFVGNADVGWKVAWSDRMVSFYGGWFLFGLLYALIRTLRKHSLRGRLGGAPRALGLSWKAALLLLLPMVVDGVSHTISDLWGLEQGFRATNAWLAALTGHLFPASFYAGDAWGSFNSLARLATGLLAAFAVIFFIFPLIDRTVLPAERQNTGNTTP